MKTLQELLSLGALASVSKEIANVALPSIRVRAYPVDETQLQSGRTKFGGSPDLPRSKGWPERGGYPLPFVAQINLSDVAPYDIDHLLPDSGIVYFFFDAEAFFESHPDDHATTWHVWYTQSSLSELQRIPIPEILPKRKRYHASAITCSTEMTLPDYSKYDSTSIERLGLKGPLTDEEIQAYYEVQAQLAGRTGTTRHIPIHRLLGYPDVVQWDMRRDLEGLSSDWQLLFQIDSDGGPGTDWGSTGRIYFWIRSQNMRRSDFSQVQLILQST